MPTSLFKVSLMHREAEKRLSDAERLNESLPIGEESDSPYLLRLLGFELLLKCVYEASLGKDAPSSHDYLKLYRGLPQSVQDRVLALARDRVGHVQLNDVPGVLADLSTNFVSLRYPYQKYQHLTEREYRAIGSDWITAGAPSHLAAFRYHPEALFGLIHALRIVLDESGAAPKALMPQSLP
ncbi:hypothetical protein M1D55_19270 [Cupriavidus sp. JZ107]